MKTILDTNVVTMMWHKTITITYSLVCKCNLNPCFNDSTFTFNLLFHIIHPTVVTKLFFFLKKGGQYFPEMSSLSLFLLQSPWRRPNLKQNHHKNTHLNDKTNKKAIYIYFLPFSRGRNKVIVFLLQSMYRYDTPWTHPRHAMLLSTCFTVKIWRTWLRHTMRRGTWGKS